MNNAETENLILLDTHAWIWLINGNEKLRSSKDLPLIEQAALVSNVKVSAISVWEVSMLEAKGRISFPIDCLDWVKKALNAPGISLAPLTPEIAVLSSRLPGNFHGDPADRIIVATALELGSGLVTKDRKILSYSEYSLIKREEFERETAELVKEEELAVIPYSPQGGGLLTGKFRKGKTVPENTRVAENDKLHRYLTEKNFKLIDEMEEIGRGYGKSIAQVSLAWHLTNPLITAPIVGARSSEQLKESIGAAGFRLSAGEMEKLNSTSEWQDANEI